MLGVQCDVASLLLSQLSQPVTVTRFDNWTVILCVVLVAVAVAGNLRGQHRFWATEV
jgi:hypothetical protein